MRHPSQGMSSLRAGAQCIGAAFAAALLLPSPAGADAHGSGPGPKPEDNHYTFENGDDPLEPFNRSMSEMNRFLRLVIIDPVIDGYQAIAPQEVQQAVSNAVSNLTEPVTAVASLLQGDGDNAANATGRFLVNTTVGLGGTRDAATDMGLEHRQEDLGQAMGSHGIGTGPHIVLPVIGPSNMRDAVGDAVIALTSPLPLAASVGSGAVRYSDNQDDIRALDEGALDSYVAERAAYEQYRRYQVDNGGGDSLPEGPSFADDTPLLTPGEEAAKKP